MTRALLLAIAALAAIAGACGSPESELAREAREHGYSEQEWANLLEEEAAADLIGTLSECVTDREMLLENENFEAGAGCGNLVTFTEWYVDTVNRVSEALREPDFSLEGPEVAAIQLEVMAGLIEQENVCPSCVAMLERALAALE